MNLEKLKSLCLAFQGSRAIEEEKFVLEAILTDWSEYENWDFAYQRMQELDPAFTPLFEKVPTVYGKDMFVSRLDGVVSRTIKEHGAWESHVVEALTMILKPGARVIHLGGHIGVHDIIISDLIGESGINHVFECNPESFPVLDKNIKTLQLTNTVLHKKAVWSDFGEKWFTFGDGNTGGAHLQDAWPEHFRGIGPKNYRVELVNLDNYLSNIEPIDLLFMDIEGAEIEALKGAQKILARSPNHVILMEWLHKALIIQGGAEFINNQLQAGKYIYRVSNQLHQITSLEMLVEMEKGQNNPMWEFMADLLISPRALI